MRYLSVVVIGTGLYLGIAPSAAFEAGPVSFGSTGPAYGYEQTGSVVRPRAPVHEDHSSLAARRDGGSVSTVSGGDRWIGPPRYRTDRSWDRDPLDEIADARRGAGRGSGTRKRHAADRAGLADEPVFQFSPGAVDPGAFYGTSGTGGGSSVVVIGTLPAEPASTKRASISEERSDPRIIDVASARLDRRPFGRDGLDVVYSGGSKIIRIAPGFGRAGANSSKDEVALAPPRNGTPFDELPAEDRQALVYPDDGPASSSDELMRAPARSPVAEPARVPTPTPAERTASAAMPASPAGTTPSTTAGEPWTEEWLRGCVARYPDFDASLGTYRDESGRRRFCTGEP